MQRTTVTFVHVVDILDRLDINASEAWTILDEGFRAVSFGDAAYTLIGAGEAWEYIHDMLQSFNWHDAEARVNQIYAQYWNLVTEDDYVNLEGNG